MAETEASPREQLLRVLRQMFEEDSGLSLMTALINQFGESLFLETLEDLVRTTSGYDQLFASATMIQMRPHSSEAKHAVAALGTLLKDATPDVRWLATFYVFDTGTATRAMVPSLARVMKELPDDDNRRFWAAGAIYHAMEF